jgi:SAM-dependent methyltransferase
VATVKPINRITNKITEFLYSFLRIEAINRLVFRLRFIYFVGVKRQVRVAEDLRGVVRPEYSISMLRRGVTSDRPLRLIRPLSVIDALDPRTAKVLSVGCRFETELLYLRAYGFRLVEGLDLVAYSPWVHVGNMHDMPYPANTWDAVVLGWVLSYSDIPSRAAAEVVRVTRDRGIVAAAVAYYPESKLRALAEAGTLVGGRVRLQTVKAILDLFEGHVRNIYFAHDAPDKDVESYCAVIFSIRK